MNVDDLVAERIAHARARTAANTAPAAAGAGGYSNEPPF